MNVSELGEFALIDRLAGILPKSPRGELIVGIGDDATVWQVGERYIIATTDTLVEGVHFASGLNRWSDVGWKAIAVSISDLAAMGCHDLLFALVTIGIPVQMSTEAVEELYGGIGECARAYEIAVVGGDTVRSDTFFVTVAALAHAHEQNGEPLLLRRDGGRAGDVIAVTGPLGDSAGGLRMLQAGRGDHPLVMAHLRPQPAIAVAGIAALMGIECGIDVSDGLLQDIGHICERSGLGATMHADALPISDQLREAFPDEALTFAYAGGEDYRIVLAAPSSMIEQLQTKTPQPLAVIGELVEGEPRVRLLDSGGKDIDIGSPGWDHLRRP
jgi:thiamine-monophosphate kinase